VNDLIYLENYAKYLTCGKFPRGINSPYILPTQEHSLKPKWPKHIVYRVKLHRAPVIIRQLALVLPSELTWCCHSKWRYQQQKWSEANPVGKRRGRNIAV